MPLFTFGSAQVHPHWMEGWGKKCHFLLNHRHRFLRGRPADRYTMGLGPRAMISIPKIYFPISKRWENEWNRYFWSPSKSQLQPLLYLFNASKWIFGMLIVALGPLCAGRPAGFTMLTRLWPACPKLIGLLHPVGWEHWNRTKQKKNFHSMDLQRLLASKRCIFTIFWVSSGIKLAIQWIGKYC